MRRFKTPALFGIVLLISMIAYSLILFIAVTDKSTNFWVGYGFTILAFLFQIPTYFLAFNKKSELKDVFLGFPIDALSSIYLAIQIVVGLVIVFVPQLNIKVGLIICILLLAGYGILLISTYMARELVVDVEEKVKNKTFYLKALLTDVEILESKTEDMLLKRKIKALADTIKYSDPMSHDSLGTIESKIESKIAELIKLSGSANSETAITKIEEIENLFVERNKKCKALK